MRSRYGEYLETLPPEWPRVPLRSIGEVVSGSTPSRAVPSNWNGDIPWATPGELTSLRSKYLTETRDHLTRGGLAGCSSGLLPVDSLLVTTRATVGVRALAGMRVATNQGFKSIVFNREVEPHFYYHLFDLLPGELVRLASGTTFLEISGREFKEILVPRPAKTVQRRIAAILDTLDDAIRRTEQVIAKLQQMKQGLLHDLLTRGVDENGDLRPQPSEAPHLYKDSSLGRIPREWDVKRVEEALTFLLDFRGRTPKKLGMEWGGGDIPALSAKNVRVGRIDLEEETYYGSSRLYEKWMTKGGTARGDVLLTTEAPLGNVAQVPDERRYILSQRVVLLRFDGTLALNDYMAFQLADERCQSNMKKWSTGTTATGIQMAKMVLIPLVLPLVAEQAVQVEMAKAADESIAAEQSLLGKYRTAKNGLLHDLLTGRVRVPLPAEVPA